MCVDFWVHRPKNEERLEGQQAAIADAYVASKLGSFWILGYESMRSPFSY